MIRRRRVLQIGAAALAMAGRPVQAAPVYVWRGTALGAQASIRLSHPDRAHAETLATRCVDEIRRLEAIFSLYDAHSALSRLNRDGRLAEPPFELLTLLSQAEAMRRLSDGAFNVRIQPLWEAYAACAADGIAPAGSGRVAEAAGLLDGPIDADAGTIRLGKPGMKLSFNGIAQGYITDRIADLLRAEGMSDLLLNLGEIRAHGSRAVGRPWQIGLPGGRTIRLQDRAVATSDPAGTVFAEPGSGHHLFDPRHGLPSSAARPVTIIAPTATLADGLSTALAVRPDSLPATLPDMADVEVIWA